MGAEDEPDTLDSVGLVGADFAGGAVLEPNEKDVVGFVAGAGVADVVVGPALDPNEKVFVGFDGSAAFSVPEAGAGVGLD